MRKEKLTVKRGSQALEMIMRDVLDGMEEISNAIQYQCAPETIQILSIEIPEPTITKAPTQITNIYTVGDLPRLHRSKDIVSYLLEREERHKSSLTA